MPKVKVKKVIIYTKDNGEVEIMKRNGKPILSYGQSFSLSDMLDFANFCCPTYVVTLKEFHSWRNK